MVESEMVLCRRYKIERENTDKKDVIRVKATL